MNPERKFKSELEEILDEQFPKYKCLERGTALVLFAYAVNYFRRYSRLGESGLEVKIKMLEQRNKGLEGALEKANKTIGELNPELAILKGMDEHYGTGGDEQ